MRSAERANVPGVVECWQQRGVGHLLVGHFRFCGARHEAEEIPGALRSAWPNVRALACPP